MPEWKETTDREEVWKALDEGVVVEAIDQRTNTWAPVIEMGRTLRWCAGYHKLVEKRNRKFRIAQPEQEYVDKEVRRCCKCLECEVPGGNTRWPITSDMIACQSDFVGYVYPDGSVWASPIMYQYSCGTLTARMTSIDETAVPIRPTHVRFRRE